MEDEINESEHQKLLNLWVTTSTQIHSPFEKENYMKSIGEKLSLSELYLLKECLDVNRTLAKQEALTSYKKKLVEEIKKLYSPPDYHNQINNAYITGKSFTLDEVIRLINNLNV